MEWCQSHAVPIKSNTTKKKAPPDQAPIEPNKGSALPSKGKQEKDQAPKQIEALIELRRQKDKILILKEKAIKEERYVLPSEDPIESKVLSKISTKKKSTKDKPYP